MDDVTTPAWCNLENAINKTPGGNSLLTSKTKAKLPVNPYICPHKSAGQAFVKAVTNTSGINRPKCDAGIN